jgi:hypothetical protein
MIDWEIVKDWAPIIISTAAIIISLVTLYVTHLRGPNIQLADPGDLYSPAKSYLGNEQNIAFLVINLLFVNSGNRSGILYKYDIPKGDLLVDISHEDPTPKKLLPLVITAGEGITITPYLRLAKPGDKEWENVLVNREHVKIEFVYKTSTGFPWNKTKKKKMEIDIHDLKLQAGMES